MRSEHGLQVLHSLTVAIRSRSLLGSVSAHEHPDFLLPGEFQTPCEALVNHLVVHTPSTINLDRAVPSPRDREHDHPNILELLNKHGLISHQLIDLLERLGRIIEMGQRAAKGTTH